LYSSALEKAVRLQRVDIVLANPQEFLASLASVPLPSLTHLRLLLLSTHEWLPSNQLQIITSHLLSSRWLDGLVRFDLRGLVICRDNTMATHISNLLARVPSLHTLVLDGCVDMILHACMRAGGSRSLPALRFVRISPSPSRHHDLPNRQILRRFLRKFSLLEEVFYRGIL